MPREEINKLPGYDPDTEKRRAEGRAIMQKLGYGPDNPLKIKVTTRDWSIYRDPAVLLIDQFKQIYIDGELELIDTAQYFDHFVEFGIAVSIPVEARAAAIE